MIYGKLNRYPFTVSVYKSTPYRAFSSELSKGELYVKTLQVYRIPSIYSY